MRLIDADKFKEDILKLWDYSTVDGITATTVLKQVISDLDNAPIVKSEKTKVGELIDAYTKGFDTGVEIARNEKPQGEYTEEDIKQAIKENFDIGYEMAKNKYERPHGEWKIGGKTTHYYYCSICGKDGDLQDNFCRNCGAKMKGGAE